MNAMIQDLVDSARLEAGQPRLDRQPTSLHAVATELVQRALPATQRARIVMDVPANLPLIAADKDRLERILVNLVSNAL